MSTEGKGGEQVEADALMDIIGEHLADELDVDDMSPIFEQGKPPSFALALTDGSRFFVTVEPV